MQQQEFFLIDFVVPETLSVYITAKDKAEALQVFERMISTKAGLEEVFGNAIRQADTTAVTVVDAAGVALDEGPDPVPVNWY